MALTTAAPRIETIVGRLHRAQTAINNALNDPDVAALLADYGYSSAVIETGKTLYDQALDLHRRQERIYGERYDSTNTVETLYKQTDATYTPLLRIARVALKGERGAEEALGLSGERKKSMTAWIDQTRAFYMNALASSAIQAKLAPFNISQEKLLAGLGEVDALETARRQQGRERGAALDATKARDTAMKALNSWMRDFINVTRVALAGRPQLLEKLGVRIKA